MSKIIFAFNTTIDGCCDHTKGRPDQEVHRYFVQLTQKADGTFSTGLFAFDPNKLLDKYRADIY